MTSSRRSWLVALAVALTALLVAYVGWFRTSEESDGWRTITDDGVRVEIPASWRRVGTNECEFVYAEHAPRSNTCALTPGLEFFGEATFDTYLLPGLTHEAYEDKTVWLGYVSVGGTVVTTSSFDPQVSKRVLDSARKAK